MNAKQMLKAAGCSDTVAGRKKFHDMYPTPKHFFAKHGGELSGAPYNGQPTAAEFFAWGQPVVGPQGFYQSGGGVNGEKPLTEEDLRALAHQERGMGRLGSTTYTLPDGIGNTVNTLTDAQQKQLYNYMDNAPWHRALYEGLPNLGTYFDAGASMIPQSSTLNSGQSWKGKGQWKKAQGGQPCYDCGGQHMNDGGNVEYKRALALVTKAMGGQAGVETRSTNNYLQNENEYLTDYLNQGQQPFMRNGGNLDRFDGGGPNPDSTSDEDGRGGPGSSKKSTNYSDGYTGNNQNYNQGYNQNYNPYIANQGSFNHGYTPYMGMFGALANTAGRFGPKVKIKNKMYGNVNYYGNQQENQGQGAGASAASNQGTSQQMPSPEGYTPYAEVIKRGLLNRIAPKTFAPKHVRAGWEKTGQGRMDSSNIPQGGGSGPGTTPGTVPGSGGKYMGPDMNEPDTTLPQMNFDRRPSQSSPFGAGFPAMANSPQPQAWNRPTNPGGMYNIDEQDAPLANNLFAKKSEPGFFQRRRDEKMAKKYGMDEVSLGSRKYYSPNADEENEVQVPESGSFQRYGGVPRFVNGGGAYTPDYRDQTDIYRGLGFNASDLNPWQIEGAAQDVTGFLNNAQNQRIMNAQRERLQNPLSTDADLAYKGNQRTFDSNIASNTVETPRLLTFAGQSNVDNQIGGSRGARYGGTMQGGGAVQLDIDDEVDFNEDELAQFLANGGKVEYLD